MLTLPNKDSIKALFAEIFQAYFALMRVMLPAIIVVKILQLLGLTAWLAKILLPLTQLLQLPSEFGLVWAAASLVNIYTGMAIFFELAQGQSYTVADVSILGLVMLFTHSIPVEGSVSKACGVPWRVVLLLRFTCAIVLGGILAWLFESLQWLQQSSQLLWQPDASPDTLLQWAFQQLTLFVIIFFVIAFAITLLKLLRVLGIEKLLHALLDPIMRVIGIGQKSANVMVVGISLGLSFGAGLLLNEARSGKLSKNDIFLSVCFLNLCHALLEDTFLIVMLGADIAVVLWLRVLVTIAVIASMALYLNKYTTPTHSNLN